MLKLLRMEAKLFGVDVPDDEVPEEPIERDENGITALDRFRLRY